MLLATGLVGSTLGTMILVSVTSLPAGVLIRGTPSKNLPAGTSIPLVILGLWLPKPQVLAQELKHLVPQLRPLLTKDHPLLRCKH